MRQDFGPTYFSFDSAPENAGVWRDFLTDIRHIVESLFVRRD